MPEDTLIPSPAYDEYLPIYYSSVADKASRVYGIDLHSQEVFHDRLDRARDNDSLSVVPDLVLHSVSGNMHGFMFSLPVYRANFPHDSVEQRRQNFLGFVHGAFRTSDAFDHIVMTSTAPRGLDLYLFAADPEADARPLHAQVSRLRANRAEVRPTLMT